MPVFVTEKSGLRWPKSRVPYVIVNEDSTIKDGVEEINKAYGQKSKLLVPREKSDAGYLRIEKVANANEGIAGVIGYQGPSEHPVKAFNVEQVFHEVFHVLGFLHEQYHQHYPWVDTDPPPPKPSSFNAPSKREYALLSEEARKASKYLPVRRVLKTDWNKLHYQHLLDCYERGIAAGGQINSRYAAMSDSANVEFSKHCDTDSVMFYPSSRKALLSSLSKMSPPHELMRPVPSGKCESAPSGILSQADVAALVQMYPPVF